MSFSLVASPSLALASHSASNPLIEAPELNRALQSLSAQPEGAAGREERIARLHGAISTYADAIGAPAARYRTQLSSADPVEVSEAMHRLAFDHDALVKLRDKAGPQLAVDLISPIPALDITTRGELSVGLARAGQLDGMESLVDPTHEMGAGLSHFFEGRTTLSLDEWAHDILSLIQYGLVGKAGAPQMSSLAAIRMAYQFALNGQRVRKAMKATESDPNLYARQVQQLSFNVLKQLEAPLVVLHGERIKQLANAVAAGKKIVLVCNHRSHLDTLVLLLVFGAFRLSFVAKQSLLKVPMLGSLIELGGHLAIDPKGGYKAIQAVTDHTLKMHEQDRAVAIFPEQTRYPTWSREDEFGLQPFKSGAFRAIESSIERGSQNLIQPVFIYGTSLVLPKGRVEGVGGKEGGLLGAFQEGVLARQPIVVDIQEPIEANRLIETVGTGPGLARRLSGLTQYSMWQEGARLQVEMNHRSAG